MTPAPRSSSEFPELDRLFAGYETFEGGMEALRPHHVRNVLLLASPYDAYALAEDVRLSDRIFGAFSDFSLSAPAIVTRASTPERALELVRTRPFDLMIGMGRFGELVTEEFLRDVKRMRPRLPVHLMTHDVEAFAGLEGGGLPAGLDRVFLWRGDVRLLLAAIKLTEDRLNVEPDTSAGNVRVIILVEDSIPFYSSYLPMLFNEILKQTSSLIHEGVNETQKLLRLRARPKVLLATTYEQAWEHYENFREVVLGVISDVRFPRGGEVAEDAGIELLRCIRAADAHTPLVLQSSDESYRETAHFLGATFLPKHSPTLLHELRDFMLQNLGFGDFVFRLDDGTEVGRAADMRQMIELLPHVPPESIAFHGRLNHFSNWLMARTEFRAARSLREKRVQDFDGPEGLRGYLRRTLAESLRQRRHGLVEDFDAENFDGSSEFLRIGGGSLGGKGRGLAFAHEMLARLELPEQFRRMRISVPPSAVIGTRAFDRFLERNDLLRFALKEQDDRTITRRFLTSELPSDVVRDLTVFLNRVRHPIAVRSSSLLEDSHHQPFAGVYVTQMLPNSHPDREIRLRELLDAIRFVYASTFFRAAKAYVATTPNRMEEEKMGVVIQQIVGRRYGDFLYPHLSGVASSWNYYPVGRMRPEDGMATLAFGLGKTVVEGGRTVRFSPRHPEVLPQFSRTNDVLANSQRQFWALDLTRPLDFFRPDANLARLDLADAERHGSLWPVASTYLPESEAVVDGASRDGIRLVTFAPVLKNDLAPVSEAIRLLLGLARRGMNGPAEIEFAANLDPATGAPEFNFLQIRPVAPQFDGSGLGEFADSDVFVRSPHVLGNGRRHDIRDIVLVRPDTFRREATVEIASDIERLNDELTAAGTPYLLAGPGRFGTADRWLGIPVSWAQISGARVILELDLEDVAVEPSQGTHFFQNMTSFGVGYFHVLRKSGGERDERWLEGLTPARETRWLRHYRLKQPLEVRIDGERRRGVILKSAPGRAEA